MRTTILAALTTAIITGAVQFGWTEVAAAATRVWWANYAVGAAIKQQQLDECQAKAAK